MTITLDQFFNHATETEQKFKDAFTKKSLNSLDDSLLAYYAKVLESHERRITIGMCEYPFTLTAIGRRCPGFYKCESDFQSKLAQALPGVAKHEFQYLNSSGLWHAISETARQKSLSNGENLSEEHAKYLGLSWALKRVGDQIQLARYDYFAQVVESGVAVAKSLAEAFEASSMGVYCDAFSSGLSTLQSDFRKFLASGTAKQQAKATVHGTAACSDPAAKRA